MPDTNTSLASDSVVKWIQWSGVDSIIAAQDDVYDYLLERGIRFPEELGFACLDLPPERSELAGINQPSIDVGRLVAAQVSRLYYSHERGLSTKRLIHSVKGE